MIELVGPVAGKRLLDLGCGDGLLTMTLARAGARSVGIDIDRSMLAAAAARTASAPGSARFVEGRVENLPFPEATFDVVVMMAVLCLLPESTQAVREAVRVLRPGGRLVIGDLARWNLWAARRRVRGWLGSRLWRAAHFSTASTLSNLAKRAGVAPEAARGAVYYPPIDILARAMAPLDSWLSSRTTLGAAFVAVAGVKGRTGGESVEQGFPAFA
jgi:ubiquinone/menaquinone biosynthesis C-methylase UbiE